MILKAKKIISLVLVISIVTSCTHRELEDINNTTSNNQSKGSFSKVDRRFNFENDTILQEAKVSWLDENRIKFELSSVNKRTSGKCTIIDTAYGNQELGRGIYYDEKNNDDMFAVDEFTVKKFGYDVTIGIEYYSNLKKSDSAYKPRMQYTIISNSECNINYVGTLR